MSTTNADPLAPVAPSIESKTPSATNAFAPTAASQIAQSHPTPAAAPINSGETNGINKTWLILAGVAGAAIVFVMIPVAAVVFFVMRSVPFQADLSTPEAAHRSYIRAQIKEDTLAAYDMVTPESQELLAGFAVYTLHGSAAIDKRAARLLEKYGIQPLTNQQPFHAGMTNANDPSQFVKLARELAQPIQDKRAFYAETIRYFASYDDSYSLGGFGIADYEVARELHSTKLINLKIDGDRARGVERTTIGGKHYDMPMGFQQIDGQWRIDILASWPGVN